MLCGQRRIAIHSTLFTASLVSTISKKYIRHGFGETIPNVFRIIGTTVWALGINAGGVLIADVHLWTLVNVWWGSSAPRHNPELDVMMKNVLVNQDIMNTYPKYCKSNLKGYGKKQNNPQFLIGDEFQDKWLTTSGLLIWA